MERVSRAEVIRRATSTGSTAGADLAAARLAGADLTNARLPGADRG